MADRESPSLLSLDAIVNNSQNLAILYLGICLGLFTKIDQGKFYDAQSLAVACKIDAAYTRRWLDAALAAGLVVYGGQRLILSPQAQSLIEDREKVGLARVLQSIYSILIADAAIPLFRSGERPGYSIVNQFKTLVPYYGLIGEALYGNRFSQEIVPCIIDQQVCRKSYGVIADYWGGDGYLLKRLITALPGWVGHVVGVEKPNETSLPHAIKFISDEAFSHVADASYDLILASRVVHHFGSTLDEKLSTFHRRLVEEGVLYIWEFAWPESPQESTGKSRELAFLNLIEHIQGNQFLKKSELASALKRAGFHTKSYDFAGGQEVLFEAHKA